MKLRISAIVDNDSVGTKVRLNDGSYGIVTHGQAAPSVGMAVERGEFGYVIPVEGTRPHQTVDLSTAIDSKLEYPRSNSPITGIQENANAVESGGRDSKDENRDYPEA